MKKWKYSKQPEQIIPQEKSFFKSKGTILIVSLGIILLMAGSALTLFSGTDSDNQVTYNNHVFTLTQTGWTTLINNQQISFEQNPKDLEDIPSTPFSLQSSKVYLLFNPSETNENSYEIQRLKSFLTYIGKSASAACSSEKDCSDLPVVNCHNQNQVVYLQYTNTSKISTQDNCIILQTDADPTRVINRFIYQILGIMQ